MQVSARNQLSGVISEIREGAVNNEVVLTLANDEKITTVITKQSCETLGLKIGKKAVALIKAPWVVIAAADCPLQFSARNQFPGKIGKILRGAINSTVHIRTDKGIDITSIITNESVDEMRLKEYDPVIAIVKASSVIIATEK